MYNLSCEVAPLIVAADLEHLIESKPSIQGRNAREIFYCSRVENLLN